ncbi:major facilitator superfamily domain-containing protein [Radiomyces spectabilis]|uniref:major facilitator superfamily domain-containing protein n=1 Tax=Radiomyces spectabilis TaxID=64574 RepID=UPI002220E40D|nr:major facilitator superfamily domain-containing protein [Radiomyces spectabilis]KAI8384702.1 major facilitator superfamily domain-containing protein [Radiomyces spectabilis]
MTAVLSNIQRRSDEEDVQSSKSIPNEEFRTYRIRYYGLTLIALLNIVSSMNWLSVAPVPDYASSFFGNVGLSVINWFSNVFLLTYVVAGPVSSFVYDRFSIKLGIVIGAGLQIIGAWLRFASCYVGSSSGKLALAMLGQTICAIGQPFILNASTPYAGLWFTADGRGTASMISGLTNAVGMAVADLVVPALVPNVESMWFGFLIIACVTTAVAIPTIFIPKRPKTPPSFSAFTRIDRRLPFHQYILRLAKNYHFLIIFLAFGILCGLTSTLTSVLPQILGPYGVSFDDAGMVGAAFIIAGVVGAIVTGFIIDKWKCHKLILKTFVPIVGFMYLAFFFVIKKDNYVPIIVVAAILGYFMLSLLPVALELSVESSYPVSESVSSSSLWMCSQIMGLVFILATDALRDDNGNPPGNLRNALIMYVCLAMPMMVLCAFYNSPNKRLECEKQNAATKEEQPSY